MPCDQTVDPAVSWWRTLFTRAGVDEAERRVLTGADCPTAMFVSSDLQAFGVLRAIRERALEVPR